MTEREEMSISKEIKIDPKDNTNRQNSKIKTKIKIIIFHITRYR